MELLSVKSIFSPIMSKNLSGVPLSTYVIFETETETVLFA
jgi:hypothetical protein